MLGLLCVVNIFRSNHLYQQKIHYKLNTSMEMHRKEPLNINSLKIASPLQSALDIKNNIAAIEDTSNGIAPQSVCNELGEPQTPAPLVEIYDQT